jgi:hypothetical protein
VNDLAAPFAVARLCIRRTRIVLTTHSRICGLTGYNTSESSLTELRIARAFVKLSAILEDEASVSLASIGNCEILMFRGHVVDVGEGPLFWLDLFDHNAKRSVDGFCCHRIKDAVPIFDDFISQAVHLSEPGGGGDEGLPDPSGSPIDGDNV